MWFFRKKQKKKGNIRKVYFGLRIRFLGLLTLVMIFIISVFTTILFFLHTGSLEKEMEEKAEILTKILHSPSEFYLDKDIDTSAEEMQVKYELINKEASSFKSYNADIVKILLINDKGKVKYSTLDYDYVRKDIPIYIEEALEQDEDTINSMKYEDPIKGAKGEVTGYQNNFAFTIPIFLKSGMAVDIINDFKTNYQKYHQTTVTDAERKKIYRTLWKKYKDVLGEEFNPNPKAVESSEEIKGTIKTEVDDTESLKSGDIDFLFLKLFDEIMKTRGKKVKKQDRKVWNEKWLKKKKKEKLGYYEKDMPAKAKEINDVIIGELTEYSNLIESSRRLGAMAIVFNEDMRTQYRFKNVNIVIIIAAVATGISIIIFLFVLQYMIKNIKKLEKWAISISTGNLGAKIEIESSDEIGRLGDVFNYMLNEMIVKYHLEKYVSSSAKKMIRKSDSSSMDLGITGRKNFAFIFADVRGFTSFSEKNDPELVIEVLNHYLELQSGIIKGAKGDIDDYVGDEIMAHFGGEKKADTAIRTAIKIMKAIQKDNAERKKKGLPVFDIGIGVHGGDVVVGNVGSGFRMDFACVGDAVNLSSRLCSAAGPGEIIVSKELFGQAKETFKHEKVSPLQLKGKKNKIEAVRIKY